MVLIDRIHFGKVLIALAIAVFGWALWLTLYHPGETPKYFGEGEFIEDFPAVIYFAVAPAFLAFPYFQKRFKWIIPVILVLMGARELDIHERVTEGGFLFFPVGFKANHPWLYALIETSAVSIAAVLLLVMFYVYRNVTRRNLERRDPHQFMMIAGWLAVGVSIALDGLANKLVDMFGVELPPMAAFLSTVMEETTEFFIPLCFAFGLFAFHQARRAGRYDPADPAYEIG